MKKLTKCSKQLKVYVWQESLGYALDAPEGMIVVLAEDEEHARRLLKKESEELAEAVADIEPEVFTRPTVLYDISTGG